LNEKSAADCYRG